MYILASGKKKCIFRQNRGFFFSTWKTGFFAISLHGNVFFFPNSIFQAFDHFPTRIFFLKIPRPNSPIVMAKTRTFIFFPTRAKMWTFIFFSCSDINTSTHQYINTPTSTHQHINTSTDQHINTSTHQHINTSTHQHINTSTHQHIKKKHILTGGKKALFPFLDFWKKKKRLWLWVNLH